MLMPFTSQEDHGCEHPGSLVPVDKRVVPDDVEEIGRRHCEQAVVGELATERRLRLRDGRLEQPLITQARGASSCVAWISMTSSTSRKLISRHDLAKRMEAEARTLAKLQHPNIVDVVTAGPTTDEHRMPFYVMDRLNGQNLRVVIEKKGSLELTHCSHEAASRGRDDRESRSLPCALAASLGTLKPMAEPKLKDVLDAVSQIQGAISQMQGDLDQVRQEMATKADVDGLRTDVDGLRTDVDGLRTDVDGLRTDVHGLRSDVKKGFADLDKELTAHAGVHREIEKDIQALKGRAPRTAARAPRPRTR